MPDISQSKSVKSAAGVAAQPEVVLGTLVRLNDAGAPLVDWPDNPGDEPVPALCTATYAASDAGRTAALLFAGGDPARPLIVGLIREAMDAVLEATELAGTDSGLQQQAEALEDDEEEVEERAFEARVDGERVVIAASTEIVLQCGKASITLTKAGKVLLRGAYLLSRSSGVNRIKGGSVQIN